MAEIFRDANGIVLMAEYRFDVFGKPVVIRAVPGGWQTFYLGSDGKSRQADFIVPADISAAGLADYLADLFHEHATLRRLHVRPLP